jgi:hypothetical protein
MLPPDMHRAIEVLMPALCAALVLMFILNTAQQFGGLQWLLDWFGIAP